MSGPSSPVVLPGSAVTHRSNEIGRFHPVGGSSHQRDGHCWDEAFGDAGAGVNGGAAMVDARQAPQVEATVVDAVVDLQDVIVRPPGY